MYRPRLTATYLRSLFAFASVLCLAVAPAQTRTAAAAAPPASGSAPGLQRLSAAIPASDSPRWLTLPCVRSFVPPWKAGLRVPLHQRIRYRAPPHRRRQRRAQRRRLRDPSRVHSGLLLLVASPPSLFPRRPGPERLVRLRRAPHFADLAVSLSSAAASQSATSLCTPVPSRPTTFKTATKSAPPGSPPRFSSPSWFFLKGLDVLPVRQKQLRSWPLATPSPTAPTPPTMKPPLARLPGRPPPQQPGHGEPLLSLMKASVATVCSSIALVPTRWPDSIAMSSRNLASAT